MANKMEYKKKQRKEDIDNRGISVAKSKLVRFLVVGIVVLVLSSSGEVFAQETSEPTWELVDTVINHANKPTEFIADWPRNAGSFNKYTIEETYFIHKYYWKDHVGLPSESLDADVEMRADFTKPPEILVPGEKITLKATVSGTGTVYSGSSLIQFEYRAAGINLRDTTYVKMGATAESPFRTNSISPYFVVPETHSGEISIIAFLWNAGAVNVRWVYRAQDSTPTDITPPPTDITPPPTDITLTPADHTVTTDEEECNTFCKEEHGSGWRGVLSDGGDICSCELTKEGCEDICQEGDVRAHYEDISSKQECYCSCDGKLREWNGKNKKCECISNAVPAEGDDCKCDSESGYKRDIWGKKCEYVDEDKNLDAAPKKIPSASTYPAYNSAKNYCGPDHLFSVPRGSGNGADFNYACYKHDKCYAECKKPNNTQVQCDQRWRDRMDASCDQAFNAKMKECDALSGWMYLFKPICTSAARIRASSCWTQASIYHTGVWAGGKIVGSYTCQ